MNSDDKVAFKYKDYYTESQAEKARKAMITKSIKEWWIDITFKNSLIPKKFIFISQFKTLILRKVLASERLIDITKLLA